MLLCYPTTGQASGHGRRVAYGAGGQLRVPTAHGACVPDRRQPERPGNGVWVRLVPNGVPVQDELAELRVPVRRRRRQRGVLEPVRTREGEGEEGGAGVAGVARPPPDLDLLGVGRVA